MEEACWALGHEEPHLPTDWRAFVKKWATTEDRADDDGGRLPNSTSAPCTGHDSFRPRPHLSILVRALQEVYAVGLR